MTRPRTCLITGTTSGIGTVTARRLAELGDRVVMACRDPDRGEHLARSITASTGNDAVEVLPCDLASLASVRGAARAFTERHASLDVLVNNAGIMTTRYQQSVDGLELTFATNYLGPFLLTVLLLDRLLALDPAQRPARIVNVASAVHSRARTPEQMTANEFSGMQAYARSKLGNIMFTLSLAERLRADEVTANSLHPGVVATNITGSSNRALQLGARIAAPFMLSPERGARTSVFLATDPALAQVSGAYFDEHQHRIEPAAAALDRTARDALWKSSISMCAIDPVPERLAEPGPLSP